MLLTCTGQWGGSEPRAWLQGSRLCVRNGSHTGVVIWMHRGWRDDHRRGTLRVWNKTLKSVQVRFIAPFVMLVTDRRERGQDVAVVSWREVPREPAHPPPEQEALRCMRAVIGAVANPGRSLGGGWPKAAALPSYFGGISCLAFAMELGDVRVAHQVASRAGCAFVDADVGNQHRYWCRQMRCKSPRPSRWLVSPNAVSAEQLQWLDFIGSSTDKMTTVALYVRNFPTWAHYPKHWLRAGHLPGGCTETRREILLATPERPQFAAPWRAFALYRSTFEGPRRRLDPLVRERILAVYCIDLKMRAARRLWLPTELIDMCVGLVTIESDCYAGRQ